MNDDREWFQKLLKKKLTEQGEEHLRRQVPFRELDERYLARLREQRYRGIPPNQRNKNYMVLELLSHVLEFKRDIIEARRELGIKEDGLQSWWEMEEWASKTDIIDYEPDFSRSDDDIRDNFPSNILEKKAFKIGIKYRLPFNFYALPYRGLPIFILTGRIVPPDSNYEVAFHFAEGDKLLWTELIAYAPLTDEELKRAMSDLRKTQMKFIPELFKDSDKFARHRYRDTIYRDIALLNEQTRRAGKPKRIKKYISGSYLAALSRGKGRVDIKMRKLEQLYKKDIIVVFDNPTSNQIGKKQGVSGAAARQAKRRLNSLTKELFGYNLGP